MNFAKSVLVLVAHSILVAACSNDSNSENHATTDDTTTDDATTGSRDDASTPSADAAELSTAEPDAAEPNTSESDTAESDGTGVQCELPESAPPNCEACLAESCETQYTACFCNEECRAQFEKVRDCFSGYNTFDEPSDDPSGDWATCEEEAGELSALYDDLMSCVASEYISPEEGAADDPWLRTDGDSQCSAACFGMFAFEFTP